MYIFVNTSIFQSEFLIRDIMNIREIHAVCFWVYSLPTVLILAKNVNKKLLATFFVRANEVGR